MVVKSMYVDHIANGLQLLHALQIAQSIDKITDTRYHLYGENLDLAKRMEMCILF